MKLSTNLILQIAGGLALLISHLTPVIPPKYAWIVTIGVFLKQFSVGVVAQNYNPDGTPANKDDFPTNRLK